MEPDSADMFRMSSPPDLAPWVEVVWYSRGCLESLHERVLPHCSTDIVANLGEPMSLCDGERTDEIRGSTVTGLRTRPLLLGHPVNHEAVGIRLSALGLRAVLNLPPAVVANRVVDLSDVVDSGHDELAETCFGVPPADRLNAAIGWLRRRIAGVGRGSDEIASWTCRQILAADGEVSIGELQKSSGYGSTQFNRRFRDELGVTPKQFARLVRFRRALDLLEPHKDLSFLALELGYSDQSHMNRDFRLFGETTPTEVIKKRYPSGLTLLG